MWDAYMSMDNRTEFPAGAGHRDDTLSMPAEGGHTAELSDAALLEQLRHRLQSALEELHARHARPVAWCAASLLPAHFVDDAIQATFLTLWDKASRIELSGDSLLPWLLGVCRNHCRTVQRKERRHLHAEIPVTTAERHDVEESVVQQQMIAAIEAQVAKLSPLDAQIYTLCIREEMTYEMAARHLGVTEPAVRNRLARLRAALRRRFDGEMRGPS